MKFFLCSLSLFFTHNLRMLIITTLTYTMRQLPQFFVLDMCSQLDASSRSTNPLTNVPRIFRMMFQHVLLTAPHPHPILFFSCAHVCFNRQEVTSSQLFSFPPSGCSSTYSPSSCSKTYCGSFSIFALSSYLVADLLRKIALCFKVSVGDQGRKKLVCI